MFMLLCGTLTSEYVLRCYMLLLQANMATLVMEFFLKLLCLRVCMEFFTNAYVHAVMRSYGWCYLCYLRDLGLRDLFLFCLSCVWLNQIGVAALSVKIEALEKQVSADSVDRALVCVRQLAGRPIGLSDGTAIVAALESLADVSRSAGHVDFKRHEAILKQCRPLTHDPRLPAVVTQLLGDDESKKIAGQIQKYLQVKRNVLKSCLTSGTVSMLTPFSPHIRATSRASLTIVPFHLAHVCQTANHVRSSRILSPPLFRSASPMVPSPCGERWENAHLRIWLCH